MAVVLYSHALVTPAKVDEFKAYLYAHTEVIEIQRVERHDGGPDLFFLLLRTEAPTLDQARYLQQYQADRFASGLIGLTIGYETRERAIAAIRGRANANGWGLSEPQTFTLSAP